MGAEGVDVDTGRAGAVAEACGAVSLAAGGIATDVRTTLGAAWLPTHAAGLLEEIEFEIGELGRFVRGVVDETVLADRFRGAQYGATWYQAMRDEWADSEAALWASLNDGDGASAIEVGSFTLSDALVDIPFSQWRSGLLPPGCETFGPGRYYRGGGAVRGPDGRLYPLVVPHLVTDDGHYTIDATPSTDTPTVASLGGADPGWAMTGYRTGIERFSEKPGMAWRFLVGAAVASGLGVGSQVDDDHLSGIHMSPGSPAIFASALPATVPAAHPIESIPAIDPKIWLVVDGRPGQYSIADLPEQNRAVRRAASHANVDHNAPAHANMVGNVVSLVAGAGQGYVAGRDLDDGNHRAYEVIFEENDDGRLRARLQSFTFGSGPDGPALHGWHVSLDDDGRLMQSPVSYQVGGDSVTSGDALVSTNPMDPDFEIAIPYPDFRGVPE